MPELTAETLVDLKVPEDVQIAPNGQQVAYTLVSQSKKEEHAISALWIASTSDARHTRQFTYGDAEDTSPRWSPDSTQIAFLSDRATRGTAQLYVITADGGEAWALTSTKI